jgi:hypothetical protein
MKTSLDLLERRPDGTNGSERSLIELEAETGETLAHARVEDVDVLVGGVVSERLHIAVAKRDELAAAGVDEIDEIAVALLRLVAVGFGVGAEGRLAVADEARVLALEEVELALDDVGEPAAAAKAEQDAS